jgi:hypothetical protein
MLLGIIVVRHQCVDQIASQTPPASPCMLSLIRSPATKTSQEMRREEGEHPQTRSQDKIPATISTLVSYNKNQNQKTTITQQCHGL